VSGTIKRTFPTIQAACEFYREFPRWHTERDDDGHVTYMELSKNQRDAAVYVVVRQYADKVVTELRDVP